jgi:polyhydroxyalkanoate synthesis regulator phasin
MNTMDTMDVRKREELESEDLGDVGGEQQLPPELIQLAGALLQAFLVGDRDSVEALYEMYHEPDKFIERQRNALKEMLRELLADGKITAEEAQQLKQEIGGEEKPAESEPQAVQTSPVEEVVIPENHQRNTVPRGKTLREIMGITS